MDNRQLHFLAGINFSLYFSGSSPGAVPFFFCHSLLPPDIPRFLIRIFSTACLSCSTSLTYIVTDIHIMLFIACCVASRFRLSITHTMLTSSALSEAPIVTVVGILDRPVLDIVAIPNMLSRAPRIVFVKDRFLNV